MTGSWHDILNRWHTVPTAGYRQRLRIAKGEAVPTVQVASSKELS